MEGNVVGRIDDIPLDLNDSLQIDDISAEFERFLQNIDDIQSVNRKILIFL